MQWTWDERKAAANYRKHRIRFETAVLVFDDDHRFTRPDPHPDDDRWQTIGTVDMTTLFVVHAEVEEAGAGRIISARRATSAERKLYEKARFEGYDA